MITKSINLFNNLFKKHNNTIIEQKHIDLDSNRLIVSFTSYQPRIKFCKQVLESLLNQTLSKELYFIILVLSIQNFPNKEKDLPQDLVELINNNREYCMILWTDRDTRSHKKLMPVLREYPNNPILVTDDDVLRQEKWLEIFYKDHQKYPNDVIIGSSFDTIDKHLNFTSGSIWKRRLRQTVTPGIIMNISRHANGLGGTLYPANTFTDQRFFDEDLMMKLCYSDDELWQFCFLVIENRRIRMKSKFYEIESIKGSQVKNLYSENKKNTKIFFKTLLKEFPEFKKGIIERQNRIIISLSFNKNLEQMKISIDSILKQSKKVKKIVLVLSQDERNLLDDSFIGYIEENSIEMIIAQKNLGDYNKYYYPMKQYEDYAVIVMNTNIKYHYYLIEQMYSYYLLYPYSVISQRTNVIRFSQGSISKYNAWGFDYPISQFPAFNLIADTDYAVLYPANSLGFNDDFLNIANQFQRMEELYLKYIENCRNVPVFSTGLHDKFSPISNQSLINYKMNQYEVKCDDYFIIYVIVKNTINNSIYNVDSKFNSGFNDTLSLKRKLGK